VPFKRQRERSRYVVVACDKSTVGCTMILSFYKSSNTTTARSIGRFKINPLVLGEMIRTMG